MDELTVKGRRAWITVDCAALRHNLRVLQGHLAPGAQLMVVMKANACGMGLLPMARRLQEYGIRYFAVAELGEGVALRKAGITCEILVLGYTGPQQAEKLAGHDIIQTVVDLQHAHALNGAGFPLRVHLKVDSGMNRLGESWRRPENLAAMFALPNLRVQGIFSHFSVSDSTGADDIAFTQMQAQRFYGVVDALQAQGLDVGLVHIQNSYGVVNHHQPQAALARVALLMYGVPDTAGDVYLNPADLRPVAALRARIAQVKRVDAGEEIGYGRAEKLAGERVLATVSLGYADGVPRALSGGKGRLLVNGRWAPIVGRVCMDMLMVDVTDIPDVRQGGVATFIGPDGDEEIRAEDVAAACGTISHELLCRLDPRVERIYLNTMDGGEAEETDSFADGFAEDT